MCNSLSVGRLWPPEYLEVFYLGPREWCSEMWVIILKSWGAGYLSWRVSVHDFPAEVDLGNRSVMPVGWIQVRNASKFESRAAAVCTRGSQLIYLPWITLCTLRALLMMLYLFSVITVGASIDHNVLHRRGMATLWQCLFAGRPALERRQCNNNKDPLLFYPSLTSLIIFPSSVTLPDIHLHLCVNHCRYWKVEGVTPCLRERWNLR